MFGLACKGLHCAGCGKGIPASIVVIIVAIAAFNSHTFDNALGRMLVEIAALTALAWVVTMVLYIVFMRKGPTIVNTKTDGIWYSEIKYMETGDDEWLAFSPRREIAPKMSAPVIIGSEVEHVERDLRLRVALLHGRSHEREDVQRRYMVARLLTALQEPASCLHVVASEGTSKAHGMAKRLLLDSAYSHRRIHEVPIVFTRRASSLLSATRDGRVQARQASALRSVHERQQ